MKPRGRSPLGLVLALVALGAWPTGSFGQAATPSAEDEAIDRQHLRRIYQALEAYRKDHATLPDWLSDLVPHYLPDPRVLLSPFEERTGRSVLWGYTDPKLPLSYVYEFGGNLAPATVVKPGEQHRLTMKQWKTLQMQEFGRAVPILRCHLYDPVLNLSYSGDFYRTGLFWESDPRTLTLAKRLGLGPGPKEQQWLSVKVVNAQSGTPLAGVEVLASNRRSTLSPLPPRSITTDAQGNCRVPLGWGSPETFSLAFNKAGYAGTPFSWDGSEGQTLPDQFTAELKPAVTIGGVVRAPSGQPIAGVTLTVNGVVHDAVGQAILVAYDAVQTDANGRWTSPRVPNDFKTLSFKLAQPECLAAEYDEGESAVPGEKQVTKADLLAGRAVMVMQPGIHVTGTVTKDAQPVAGARVVLRDTSDTATNRLQRTDAQGRFDFVLLQQGEFNLAVETGGASPALQTVAAEPGIKPIRIALAPGRTIRGCVTDGENQPVSGAAVAVTAWRDLPVLAWQTTTDSQGRFAWDAAPPDPVTLSVNKAGYNPVVRSVTAGTEQPVVFQLTKTFRLSGKVVDADTGKPINAFKLIRGDVWNPAFTNQVNWESYTQVPGNGGRYAINGLDRAFGGSVEYMVTADGYLPAATPPLSPSGWHTHDFALHQGQGPSGIVELPDGRPAPGAEVALLGVGYVSLGKGALRTMGANNAFQTRAGADGGFSLPAVLPAPTLVAVDPDGFAEFTADTLATNRVVVLQPWGRVEGTLWLSQDPGANQELMIADQGNPPPGLNFDWDTFKTTTDARGHFAFSFVPPGRRQVVRLIPQGDRSWMWSDQTPVVVKPGEIAHVKVGGGGCRVLGRVLANGSKKKVDWQSGRFMLHTQFPRPPHPLSSREEAEKWNTSPAFKAAMAKYRNYPVTVQADGSFRIDNVRAGEYTLEMTFTEPELGRPMGMGQVLGRISRETTVPAPSHAGGNGLLDLGALEVQLAQHLLAGKPAPEIQGVDVNGDRFKLSDYRGKVVLIDFWGDW